MRHVVDRKLAYAGDAEDAARDGGVDAVKIRSAREAILMRRQAAGELGTGRMAHPISVRMHLPVSETAERGAPDRRGQRLIGLGEKRQLLGAAARMVDQVTGNDLRQAGGRARIDPGMPTGIRLSGSEWSTRFRLQTP